MSILQKFYLSWSKKDNQQIQHDIYVGIEKANIVINAIKRKINFHPKIIIDIGCGYGTVLSKFIESFQLDKAYGIDYSRNAIDFAQAHYQNDLVKFETSPSLDIDDIISQIKLRIGNQIDAILLFDILEHFLIAENLSTLLAKLQKFSLSNFHWKNHFLII